MKPILMTFLFALIFTCGIAQADCKQDCPVKNRSQDQDCPLEMTPLTRCEEYSNYKIRDSKLNVAYKNLVRKVERKDALILRDTQRSWLAWRLEKCDEVDEQAKCDNGVCAGVAHDNCIIGLTKQRTDELVRFAADVPHAKLNAFGFKKQFDER